MLKMQYFGHVMRTLESLERYNAGNNCRSKEEREAPYAVDGDIKSVTGLSVNDLNQSVKDRKTWNLLVNSIVKKRKWTNVKSKKATAE